MLSIPFNKLPCFQASKNSQNEPYLGDVFEPLLAKWTEELASKARAQMDILYEIQVEEKKENDLKDKKAENWKAYDQTLEIQRIFRRSHTEWHDKCKDNGLSPKQTELYSKFLYSSLVDVLYEYSKKLAGQEGLILEDNHFDKSEFIMVINCMHGSVDYLINVFKMYEDEIFFRVPTMKIQNGEF